MTTAATGFPRRGTLKGRTYGWRVGRGLLARLLACLAVAQQRHELRALDDRTLLDIGVRRLDAEQEADRGFWDLPDDLEPRP